MSRLAFRAAAAVVGVALLAVYLAAAAFVADALRFLWATRPDLPVLLALLAVVAVGSAYLSYWIGTAQVLASLESDRLPRERAPDLHRRVDARARRGWPSTARRCTSPTPGRRTRSRSVGSAAAPRDRPIAVSDPLGARGGGNRRTRAGAPRNERRARARDGRRDRACSRRIHHGACAAGAVGAFRVRRRLGGVDPRRPGDRSGPFARLHRALANGLFGGFVLATLLARSRSRKREFAADDRAAEVTGDPIDRSRGRSGRSSGRRRRRGHSRRCRHITGPRTRPSAGCRRTPDRGARRAATAARGGAGARPGGSRPGRRGGRRR